MAPGKPIWWGSVGMQGWRSGMEDAHINDTVELTGEAPVTQPNGPAKHPTGYRHAGMDGHGGARVAEFVKEYFKEAFITTEEFKKADY